MTYRVFTFMRNHSLKTVLINSEAISEAIKEMEMENGIIDLGAWFIGKVDQWTDHGEVEIDGPGMDMLDDLFISD